MKTPLYPDEPYKRDDVKQDGVSSLGIAAFVILLLVAIFGSNHADAAYSVVTYPATGSQTAFSVPYPYILQTDITVTDNGTVKVLGTDYSFTSSNVITFTVAPLAGHTVVLTRSTPVQTPDVVYSGGSISSQSLNLSTDQLLYGIQELRDLPVSPGSANYAGSPLIPGTVSGLATNLGVTHQFTYTQATKPEVGDYLTGTSAVGSGSFLYFKVNHYNFMNQLAGSSDAFAYNGVLSRSAGVTTTSGIIAEYDLNNNDQDYTTNGYPYVANIVLTGQGTHVSTCAICIDYGGVGSNYQWNWGIVLSGTKAFQAAAIEDDSSAPTSIKIQGSHTFGIDLLGSTDTVSIRLPNTTPIKVRNGANSADLSLIYDDGGDSIHIGDGSVSITLGSAANTVDIGSYRQHQILTVASLPACTSGNLGLTLMVSDATSPVYRGALVGSGAVKVPVWCNGSTWESH